MKNEDLRWFDDALRCRTRREFLGLGASAAALVVCGGSLPARRGDAAPRFRSGPFELGVAPGDPLPEGIVLWNPAERSRAGGGRHPSGPRARPLGGGPG